jgi:sulfonate transport system substrate-binding protein
MKMKMMKILSIGLMSVLMLSGCNSKQEKTESATIKNEQVQQSTQQTSFSTDKIAVTYVTSPLNVVSIIQKDKQLFEKAFQKYNLPVAYSNLTSGPDQTQALASGDLQFLNCVGGTSVIIAASNGLDLKIMSTYSRSPKTYMLITNKDSINSPQSLKGKKVAGPKGTILHELLVTYLSQAGLKESDIQFVSMGIPESAAALASGKVDVALLAGAQALNSLKDRNKMVTSGENILNPITVTATSTKFAKENPTLVETFLNVQKEAVDFMHASTEESISLTAKETGLTLEEVKEMYGWYDFNQQITEKDIASLKATEAFLFENKMIENRVNIESLILK